MDERDAAYSALPRGGSAAGTSRTDANVDGVRRGAAEQIPRHPGAPRPGPRPAMTARSWIAGAEAMSPTWLDEGKRTPAEEVRTWLVDHFAALLPVSSTTGPKTAGAAPAALERESGGGPAGGPGPPGGPAGSDRRTSAPTCRFVNRPPWQGLP
ncbi:hypothetical protein [Actinacidiphila sp. bgisy167]|uniref:hypothetical protein n=1 Tax=Actinacidiphila sp. bgisy167 TaxID=3413797 RepID=UPI003D73DE94